MTKENPFSLRIPVTCPILLSISVTFSHMRNITMGTWYEGGHQEE